MTNSKKKNDFIQDSSYAVHFGEYRSLLSRFLNHDPEMFKLSKNDLIVDVGCGYGDLLLILKERSFKNFIGIEPDAVCRKDCIKNGLDVRNGTISDSKLPNAFADVVIVNEVFHHIKDFKSATKEISRILKPGGIICFIEPYPTILRKIMDILTFHTPLPKYFPPVKTRYEVMKLEMETGLYPNFLKSQKEFQKTLESNFTKIWFKKGWFFQFGKYKKTNK